MYSQLFWIYSRGKYFLMCIDCNLVFFPFLLNFFGSVTNVFVKPLFSIITHVKSKTIIIIILPCYLHFGKLWDSVWDLKIFMVFGGCCQGDISQIFSRWVFFKDVYLFKEYKYRAGNACSLCYEAWKQIFLVGSSLFFNLVYDLDDAGCAIYSYLETNNCDVVSS